MATLFRMKQPILRALRANHAPGFAPTNDHALNCLANRKLVTAPTIPAIRFASSSSTNRYSNKESKERNIVARAVMASDDQSAFERTVYVHPLSQIVLEYFQDVHHNWIVAQQLDTALTVHRDGSFELKFPMAHEEVAGEDVHRIWTSYDEVEKKHWLSVYRGPQLQKEFLLQDNLLPAWNNHRKSLPERIHVAVDELIQIVNKQAP